MTDLFEKCQQYTRPREFMAAGLYPYFKAIESSRTTEVVIEGRKMLMLGSNNYLGLTGHPKVVEAAIDAVRRYGSGCTGSRFLNGTLDLHVKLEAALADFMGKPAALIFSTGFQTNQGTLATIAGKGDVIFSDRDNHASIVDGNRLSFAEVRKYRHGDLGELREMLSHAKEGGGKLVVTDGVFSMLGDLAPLREIVELTGKYRARLMVDEAHGIGVFGEHGRGAVEHCGILAQADIVMGTFSKSFASLGGFIVAEREVIDFIKHHARALIFSASPTPASTAAALASLEIIRQEPERREQLWRNARKMKAGFAALGFDTGPGDSPIIPIIIGDERKTFRCWKMLSEAGIFVNPVVPPAAPGQMSLLRTSYMATHTASQLDFALETFAAIGKQLELIR